MSFISRLNAVNFPWHYHLLATITYVFLPSDYIRPLLWTHVFLSFFLNGEKFLYALQHPSEPPLIPHPYLPFLGHVIGMFFHGGTYFARVNASTQYPIFSLQTLNTKSIGVIEPQVAATVQRASKNTSFYGAILEVAGRLVGFDGHAMGIVRDSLDPGKWGPGEGMMGESNSMIESILSKGPELKEMSRVQVESFGEDMEKMFPRGMKESEIETSLMDFVKKLFTTGTSLTFYGPQNPFVLYPELVQTFWDYEDGMIGVLAGVLPWITARKGWKARRAMNVALKEYVEKGYWHNASILIQRRIAINLKHGLTTEAAGQSELIMLFGILGNAVPSTFWLLCNILSRPELLKEIRDETRKVISSEKKGDGEEKTINITDLQTNCPLLVSTYRETLRHVANLASVRLVTKNHTVTPSGHRPYLLKKNTMVQIAGGVIHESESVWGPDSKAFNPERFITTSTETGERTVTALPKNVSSAAFRAFGGGSVICPGRHFAQTEIVGFAALVVNMLDVEGLDGETMKLPKKDDTRIPLSAMKPVVEQVVRIRRRVGGENVRWRLGL